MSTLPQDNVAQRQKPLRQHYQQDPSAAWISDQAVARPAGRSGPFHGEVVPGEDGSVRWAYGIHRAVGGDHDAPNPGDLLSAALAACLQSSTRMIAAWLAVSLRDIEVAVTAHADVRGTLLVDSTVPVGFQSLHCKVTLETPSNLDGDALRALMAGAERACVVMQTIKGGTEVTTEWCIEQELTDAGSAPTAPAPGTSTDN